MGVSDAKQCQAIIRRTGKRCRQPAMRGAEVCRFHAAYKVGEEGAGEEAGAESSGKSVGAPRQNVNALRHGAYSPRLLPDEEPIYEEKRKAFTEALGTVDVFDEQIIHLLAIVSVKVDKALLRGAEHAAYGGMIKQILDLMQQLKVTRASRDRLTDGQGLTYADLFAAMKAHLGEPGVDGSGKAAGCSTAKVMEHYCNRCGFSLEHKLEEDGRWRCQNCGHVTDIDLEDEQRSPSGGADDDEAAADTGKEAGVA